MRTNLMLPEVTRDEVIGIYKGELEINNANEGSMFLVSYFDFNIRDYNCLLVRVGNNDDVYVNDKPIEEDFEYWFENNRICDDKWYCISAGEVIE